MTHNKELPRQIIITPTKSVGISIMLKVVFGPLGMFHSGVTKLLTSNGIKILASLIIVIVPILGPWQSSHANDHEITAILKKPFRIELSASTGSTGYSWFAQFDDAFLKLEKSSYEKPESKLLGAPGKQAFMFLPLKPGNTKIEMRLKRPWESSTLKVEVYQISILP